MSTRRVYSLRQASDHKVHTSLLDNWHYQSSNNMDLPQQIGSQLGLGTLNINEDDMDCPGHGVDRHPTLPLVSELWDSPMASGGFLEDMYNARLAASSSSEGFYDSCGDEMTRQVRAMSVDEVSHHNDSSNNNVCFDLTQFHFDEDNTGWDSHSKTMTAKIPSAARDRLDRRASINNGMRGMCDEKPVGTAREWHGSALTEPDTPAEMCTPLASSSVSLENLDLDSQSVSTKAQLSLCADRLNRMTRTCTDIEAVTRQLEEKEHDLELAARIGKALLSNNKDLNSRKELLEEQLTSANDRIEQLKHELSKKVQELEVYDQDLQNQNLQDDSGVCAGDSAVSSNEVEKLQRKMGSLEEENLSLRMEMAKLHSDTEVYEKKEKKMLKDSMKEIGLLNQKVEVLTEELKAKKEESNHHRLEINALFSQLNGVCGRVRQLTEENADLLDKLQAAQESQTQLTRELSLQKDKYDELFESLEKAQEQLMSRSGSKGSKSSSGSPRTMSVESLASELQKSLSLELSHNEERQLNKSQDWKVFETARAAHKAVAKSRSCSRQLSSSASSCWDVDSLSASVLASDTESFGSDGYGGDTDSICGSSLELGRPGIPGSNDLQTALQRLSLRQGQDQEDLDGAESDRSGVSPLKIPGTPDTVSSSTSGYSYLGCSKNGQSSSSQYKMSRKLQIIKPLEGSSTLQQWQRLAQPHLGGLFECRDGVKVKGERKLDLEGEAYTLSDYEENGDLDGELDGEPDHRWNPMNHSSPSRHHSMPLLHTPSPRSGETSHMPMATSTPHPIPADGKKASSSSSTGSYTMSLGLAAILQERDTSLARALMKTSTSCPKISPASLARSGSVAIVPAESTATVSATQKIVMDGSSSGKRETPSTKDSNSGLFGKLISSGYSLLWNKSDTSAAQESTSAESANKAAAPTGGAGVFDAMTSMRKNGIF